jgi:hypothetical protein
MTLDQRMSFQDDVEDQIRSGNAHRNTRYERRKHEFANLFIFSANTLKYRSLEVTHTSACNLYTGRDLFNHQSQRVGSWLDEISRICTDVFPSSNTTSDFWLLVDRKALLVFNVPSQAEQCNNFLCRCTDMDGTFKIYPLRISRNF